MNKSPNRQRIRLSIIILSFFLYPITFAYISCPIITEAAYQGILTGGLIVFVLLFFSSLIFGRFWCGYLCPSGGLQEIYHLVFKRKLLTRKLYWVKYFIFLGIYGTLFYAIWSVGGLKTVDLWYRTDNGISITAVGGLASFLGPVIVISIFALILGKRGFCHTFCPIAVMLILGRKVRNLVRWPALQLRADRDKCIDCYKCSEGCPMSLDVNRMVHEGKMEQADCILCGACVDTCPKDVISYMWSERLPRQTEYLVKLR